MTVGHLGEVGGEGYVGVGFEISRQLVVEPGWMGQFGRARTQRPRVLGSERRMYVSLPRIM